MLLYKSFEAVIRKATATPSDLATINESGLAMRELTAEEVFIGRMALCNNQYDRSWERFPEGYLKRFADTIVGKSVMTGHDYRTLPVGRFFDAEVRAKSGDWLDLVPAYYMLADDDLVPKITAGVVKGVSIGFEPDLRLCDIDGKDYDGWWNDMDDDDPCHHICGREYTIDGKQVRATVTYGGKEEVVEAVEGSFVWLGCQYEAETIGQNHRVGRQAKSAFFAARNKGGVWALDGNGLTIPADTAGRPPRPQKEKGMANDPKAADKDAPSAAEAARTERLVKAGETYMARLLKTIETRYAALDMEDTGKSLAESLKDAGVEALELAEGDANKLFDAKLGGGAKGTPDSAGDAAAQADKQRVFNPLAYRVEELM